MKSCTKIFFITIVVLLTTTFSNLSFAQDQTEETYTFHLVEVTYADAMDSLEAWTPYSFVYSDDNIPMIRRVSFDLKDESIHSALKVMFNGTFLDYDIVEGKIIVKVVRTPFDSPAGLRLVRIPLSGKLTDMETGEELIGATVLIKDISIGTAANLQGYYAFNLPKGKYTLTYTSVGFLKKDTTLELSKVTELNISLEPDRKQLKEVVIYSKDEDAEGLRSLSSSTKVNPVQAKETPALLGEPDLIKVLQMLPGIQAGTEGIAGVSVRGGDPDQNLALVDDTPIYNMSHFMGLFSIFNPDAVRDVEVYKAGIPARYGGRLSSVLDVRLKEGNRNKWSLVGGVGTIAGRFLLEGPINQGKGSLVLSGRRSYIDWLVGNFNNLLSGANKVFFYDTNFKFTYQLNKKHKINISSYLGQDETGFQNLLVNKWGNASVSAGWGHIMGNKLYGNMEAWFTNYKTISLVNLIQGSGYSNKYALNDAGFRYDLDVFASPGKQLKAGVEVIFHNYKLGEVDYLENDSIFVDSEGRIEEALETAAYLQYDYDITQNFRIGLGLRYSRFDNFAGDFSITPQDEESTTINPGIDTTYHDNPYQIVHSSHGLEPRISLNYILNKKSSLKFSYDRMRQNIFRLVDENLPQASGVWLPSNGKLAPSFSDQLSLSLSRRIAQNQYEIIVEGYYKSMENLVDYKPNTFRRITDLIEYNLLAGQGEAYGFELLAQKKKGDFTAWVSYNWSKAIKTIQGINDNESYPTSFDRRHNVAIVGSYQLNKQVNFTLNWIFATGLPYTFPAGRYEVDGYPVPFYTSRNDFRLPSTHHLDLSMTFYRKMSPDKRNESSFNFSIYNVYGRKNPYAYVFRQSRVEPNQMEVVKLYLFSTLPSFSYSFRF